MAEKRKIHRVVDASGTLVQVLPETSAEQVTVADAGNKFTSSNVEGALQELATGVASAGKVDDVRNKADDASTSIVTNKIADMSKAVVKEAGKVTNALSWDISDRDGGGSRVTYSYEGSAARKISFAGTDFETATDEAENSTPIYLKTTGVSAGTYQGLTVDAKGRVTAAQDMDYANKKYVQEIVAGKAGTLTYDTYQAFVTAVDALGKDAMIVGTNVLIKALNVPDMWCMRVNAVSTQYKYVDDQSIITALNTTTGLTVGYFTFSQLETTKFDTSEIDAEIAAIKSSIGTLSTLTTTDKTSVVNAINEVNGVAKGASSKADTNKNVLDSIIAGTTAVGEAKDVSTSINGVAISDIFESDGKKVKNATNADTATSADKVGYGLRVYNSAGTVKTYNGSKNLDLEFEKDFSMPKGIIDNSFSIGLSNTGVTAGQYSAVNVDAKGRVTAGGKSVEWGTSGQTAPSDDLMVGGIFWELQ